MCREILHYNFSCFSLIFKHWFNNIPDFAYLHHKIMLHEMTTKVGQHTQLHHHHVCILRAKGDWLWLVIWVG